MSDTPRAPFPTGLRLLPTILLLATLAAALAQPPELRLEPTDPRAGDTAVLSVTGLEPDAAHPLVVEAPDGAREEFELQAGPEGGAEREVRFETPGAWSLRLDGPGGNASLVVEVAPAEATEAGEAEEPEGVVPAAPGADGQEREETAAPPEGAEREETAPDEEGAEPGEPAAEPRTERAPAEPERVVRQRDAVVAEAGGEELWRLDFPPDSGGTGEVLEHLGRVWAAHGNSVLELDRATGGVERRYLLPARVTALDPHGEGVSAVVAFGDGLTERLELAGGEVRGVVRFGADPVVFGWLRAEAEVPDPAERLERDPTNPWLHALAGDAAASGAEARRRFTEAVERADAFYDLAALSRFLLERDQRELAARAMDEALRDFAERGYTPELLTRPELRAAYGFPVDALETALERGDLETAGFWAPWVQLLAAPEAPDTGAALRRYAAALRADGRVEEAATWRERARAGRRASAATTLDRVFAALGRLGALGVGALLAAAVLLVVALTAKYWVPQSAMLRRRAAAKSRIGPVPRLFAIRFFSFTEKLVLVLLLAAALALAALAAWGERSRDLPAALGSGTLASAPAREFLESARLVGERGAYVRGYAAQVAGEDGEAARRYEEAAGVPAALNNLGALRGDEALYQRALDLSPGLTEPRYNLGLTTSPTPFHERYRADEPMLDPPAPIDLQIAVAGGWERAVETAFLNPWAAFVRESVLPLPLWVRGALLMLFLLVALAAVLSLLVPRPRLARNAPRTPLYHLLALLLPGVGLADEAWGVLLLLPWALFGADALAQLAGWGAPLGLPLEVGLWVLGLLYLVNVVAFVVEFVSYRRRMAALRRDDPELALELGLKPRPRKGERAAG